MLSSISRRFRGLALCAVLLATFSVIAWSAVSGKSATVDEPGHSITGWFMLYARDFRWSAEVPPLWEEWISLPMGGGAIHYDPDSPAYKNIRIRRDISTWEMRTLYQTPGNDGVELVRRGRIMALILGVALAALIARWSWRLAGPVAGVAAMFMFVWDPNFLGHAPLAKNDVGMTLAYLAAAYAYWRAGEELNWTTATSAILATAAAILTKFSGLLLGPVMVVVFGWRALDGTSWKVLGRSIAGRGRKLAAVGVLGAVTLAILYAAIWAIYDFRFSAGPGDLQLDSTPFIGTLRDVQVFKQVRRQPSEAELSAWRMPLSTRTVLWAQDHRLLPQAFLAGFIITQSGSESRLCYLNGQFYNGGKWYYFPLAALYKAPLATIAALALAAWIGLSAARRGLLRDARSRWAAIALAVPALAYAAVALASNINIGLRHFFPFYPFVFIAIGLAAARIWATGAAARFLVAVLGLSLAVETALAYPNYISFFDCLIGQRTGYELLSDSNIDWGQDLPLLAEWQHKHPDVRLYLDYQGQCDPAMYGIHYVNVYGGYPYGPPKMMPDSPGVLAISATKLHMAAPDNRQRIRRLQTIKTNYMQPETEDDLNPPWAGLIQGREPEEILGGSIYLYRIDPQRRN